MDTGEAKKDTTLNQLTHLHVKCQNVGMNDACYARHSWSMANRDHSLDSLHISTLFQREEIAYSHHMW